MLHLIKLDRTYSLDTIAVMTKAFERVCGSLSSRMNGNNDVKEKLARIIFRHTDLGERDAQRLADSILCEWTGTDRAATR